MAEFAATYVDSTTFRIAGNVEAYFPAGVVVRVDCGGWVRSPVASSSYSLPNTTVILEDAVLTDPCGDVEVSCASPEGVPIHDHSDSLAGGTDVVGTAPAHEWDGTSLRFRNPDGSWGVSVDLTASVSVETEERLAYSFMFWGG